MNPSPHNTSPPKERERLGEGGAHREDATEAEIDTLLSAARARVIVLRGLSGAGLGLAAAALSILVGAAVMGAHPAAWVHHVCLSLSAMAFFFGPVVAAIASWRLTRTEIGRQLTENEPRIRSLLLSALELRDLPPDQGVSLNLVRAQAVFAATRLRELDPLRAISSQAARGSLALGVACALASLAVLAKGPEQIQRGVLALRAPPAPAKAGVREPITGDVELTFFYPAHTRLAPRTVSGTNGEIQAPAGTEVRLQTRADRPVTEAAMVVNGAAVPLIIKNERQLSGSFTVSKAGSYLFRFGPASRPTAEGPPIPIGITIDAPPQITLSAPPETLEVEPQQILTLRYQATDDYGISDLRLVYRPPGSDADKSIPIKQFEDPPTRDEGSARFDLAPLHLLSGDELSYFLEAHDNDAVQGPKAGRSRPHHLTVYSEVEHHREALAQARALWERLLLLLADRLDDGTVSAPNADGAAADVRALTLATDMAKEAATLLKDKHQDARIGTAFANAGRREKQRAELTAATRALLSHNQKTPRATQELTEFRRALRAETEALEQDTLYLEGLLDQASKDDIRTLFKELAARRRELSDLVEKYRQHPTPELKQEIQALVARLKTRMGELFAREQELAKSISDQHLNREALAAQHKKQDLSGSLSKADEALQNGDIDAALKSLNQLAQSLDTMQQKLDKTKTRQSEAYPGLNQKLAALKDKLSTVEQEQKEIVEKTQSLEQEIRKTAGDRNPASPQVLEKLRADAERARAELSRVPDDATRGPASGDLTKARDRADQLSRALAAQDLGEARHAAAEAADATGRLASELARPFPWSALDPMFAPGGEPPQDSARDAANHVKQADPILRSIQARLEKLFPDEKNLLGSKEQQQIQQLQRDQARTQEDTQKLSQQLEQIGKEAPVFDPSATEALNQASDHMQEAQGQLSQQEPGRAGEEERGALEQLQKLSQSMQQGKGQSEGEGFPSPFSFGQPSNDNGEGSEGSEQEKVVVPDADQYQVPAEFRRDILDAMKRRAPASFEDQVKKYYREIVK